MEGEEEKELYGTGATLKKLKLKAKILLYDLLLSDDSIEFNGNKYYIRNTLSKDKKLLKNLFDTIKNSDLNIAPEYQLR